MTFGPEAAGTPLPASPPIHDEAEPSGIRNIFRGPDGIRAGWRFLMFVTLFAGLQYIFVQRGLRLIPGFGEIAKQAQAGGVLTPTFSLVFEGTELTVVLLATWIMGRVEKRPFGTYGIPLKGPFGKLFWQGVLWGWRLRPSRFLPSSRLADFLSGRLQWRVRRW